MNEFEIKLREGNYWEIVHNKKVIKGLKRSIKQQIDEYNQPKSEVHKKAKLGLIKNLYTYMKDFMEVLEFTIAELENEVDLIERQRGDRDVDARMLGLC